MRCGSSTRTPRVVVRSLSRGSGSFGAGLTRSLTGRGERVLEVSRVRRERRPGGKTDALDAVRAASQRACPGAAGDASGRRRIHFEAAFAWLAGAAPIPASSGQTVRHGLDRSGDRKLNRALHMILVTETHTPANEGLHRTPHPRRQNTTRSKPLPQALPRPQPLSPTRTRTATGDLTNIEASLAQATVLTVGRSYGPRSRIFGRKQQDPSAGSRFRSSSPASCGLRSSSRWPGLRFR